MTEPRTCTKCGATRIGEAGFCASCGQAFILPHDGIQYVGGGSGDGVPNSMKAYVIFSMIVLVIVILSQMKT